MNTTSVKDALKWLELADKCGDDRDVHRKMIGIMRLNHSETIRAALQIEFHATTDYYDPEKLTPEQREKYEKVIGSALIHAKTWARSDAEYMAAKTGAHRAVIGLIKIGML